MTLSLRTAAIALAAAVPAGFLGFLGGKSSVPSQPSTYSGHPSVKDGDDLLFGKVDVRLYGIDAPEKDQECLDAVGLKYPCGRKASDTLAQLIESKTVTCDFKEMDRRNNRPLVLCRLDDGRDLNAALVRAGVAVVYHRKPKLYAAQQDEAKAKPLGLWAGTFDPPHCVRGWKKKVIRKGCPPASLLNTAQ